MNETAKLKIEGLYQRAMNLRDSSWSSINFEPIEDEYRRQYQRAFRVTQDVTAFAQQTKEYRALVRSFKQERLGRLASL